MSMAKVLRNRVVDAPGSVADKTRARRWAMLQTTFPDFQNLHVVDLGGTVVESLIVV